MMSTMTMYRVPVPMGLLLLLLLASPWRTTTERSFASVVAFSPLQCPNHRSAAGRRTVSSTWQRHQQLQPDMTTTRGLRSESSTLRRHMSADGDADDNQPPTNEEAPDASQGEETASSSSLSSDTTDILNSPVFLKRKLEVLQKDMQVTTKELEAAQEQLKVNKAEWSTQLDELAKEYQQIQSRMNAQNSQGDSMATIQVVRQMLGVLDTFDRAFGVVQPTNDEERAVESEYRAVYTQILDTFTKLGVEVVPTVGAEFDYEVHQAVMQRPSDDFDEGVVCEELQKGFKLGDQLVRAAMVVVAA